ncbi:TPA: WG repeat-containing protein [Campylobacter coli]|nr:WG repeat-containing protein [Campylobacter coli]
MENTVLIDKSGKIVIEPKFDDIRY